MAKQQKTVNFDSGALTAKIASVQRRKEFPRKSKKKAAALCAIVGLIDDEKRLELRRTT